MSGQTAWVIAAIMLTAVVFGLGRSLAGHLRGRPRRRTFLLGDSGSTATFEFVLTFPIFVLASVVLVQVIFVVQAHIVVEHAAFCASRSASVWMGQPGGFAQGEATSAAVIGVLPVASKVGPKTVHIELLPLLAGDRSSRGVGRQLLWLSSKYEWARRATTVALGTTRIGPEHSPFQSVTATVTHRFHLAVPYAGELLGGLVGSRFAGKPTLTMSASATMLVENKLHSKMKLKPKNQSWFGI